SLSAPSPVPACGSEQDAPSADDPACTAATTTPDEIAQARAYLVETASPGYTMTLQGPEIAIGRLHPEFAVRLEHAIREARSAGLPFASIFSAYRPPGFGVGGFSDKFNSHLWACRRHARHRCARFSRSAVVARDRREERRRVPLRPAQPGGMESLSADKQ